jgi:uncharacterized protein (TIGR03435 family)
MKRLILGTAIFMSIRAFGQTTATAFEVASIKPNTSDSGNSSIHTTKGQIMMENVTLKQCIEMAFDVRDFTFSGPAWLDTVRFDIVAKPPAGTPSSQLMPMLQSLLADRFRLVVHRESNVVPAYALLVGKKGAKVEPVAETAPGGTSWGRGQLSGKNISMAGLADMLARQLERPVKDMTGLPGVFNVKLVWTPDDARPLEPTAEERKAVDNMPAAPSLFAALQEQLGLRLEAQKLPVEILVVDHAERAPAEN